MTLRLFPLSANIISRTAIENASGYIRFMGQTVAAADAIDAPVTNMAETMRVDLINQRVGIGTTAPSTKLHVNGDVRIDGQATATPTNTTTVVKWLKINADGTTYYMPLYQ